MFTQIFLIGHVGNTPELRYTPAGQSVCNFSVATNRRWTNADGSDGEETTWFRVSTWGKQAEAVASYLKKGAAVAVVGRLRPDATGNPRIFARNDGTAGASYEIVASTVRFLTPSGARNTEDPQDEFIPEMSEDDPPF